MLKKFMIVFAVVCLLLSLCACGNENHTYIETDEIIEYDVLSVVQYIQAETNRFGGVEGSHLCYAFTFISNNGMLKTVDDFENLEYGLTKVFVGDSDKYVINRRSEERYLYLTRDTLAEISGENVSVYKERR